MWDISPLERDISPYADIIRGYIPEDISFFLGDISPKGDISADISSRGIYPRGYIRGYFWGYIRVKYPRGRDISADISADTNVVRVLRATTSCTNLRLTAGYSSLMLQQYTVYICCDISPLPVDLLNHCSASGMPGTVSEFDMVSEDWHALGSHTAWGIIGTAKGGSKAVVSDRLISQYEP